MGNGEANSIRAPCRAGPCPEQAMAPKEMTETYVFGSMPMKGLFMSRYEVGPQDGVRHSRPGVHITSPLVVALAGCELVRWVNRAQRNGGVAINFSQLLGNHSVKSALDYHRSV